MPTAAIGAVGAVVLLIACFGLFVNGQPYPLSFGAVLSESGPSAEMQFAKLGYQLWAHKVNEAGGFSVGSNDVRYTIDFTSIDDRSNALLHYQGLQTLIANGTKYIMGSHPSYAFNETAVCDGAGVINVQCCVGPEPVYAQGFKHVFGVQTTNTKYSELLVRALALRQVKKVAFAYYTPNIFTLTTCQAAIEYAAMDQLENVLEIPYGNDAIDYAGMRNIAEAVAASGAEVFFACALLGEGVILNDALLDVGYPLHATFMTIAPTNDAWIASQGKRAAYLYSAGQWHPKQRTQDDYYGTSAQYSDYYRQLFGAEPNYVGAGATVAGYTLMKAIQAAYEGQVHTPYDIDKQKVLDALVDTDLTTFFGRIEFNRNQRNIRKDPVTVQVLQDKATGQWVQECVLPAVSQSAEFVFPRPGTVFVKTTDPVGLALTVITSLLMAFYALILVGVIIYADSKVIRAASPAFCATTIIGAMMGLGTMYLFFDLPTDVTCMLRPWLGGIGFTFMFGSLFSKTARINLIYGRKTLKVSSLTNKHLAVWISLFVLVDIVILAAWTADAPLVAEFALCQSVVDGRDTPYYIAFFTYKGVLSLWGAWMAYHNKDAAAAFNDSNSLAIAIYNTVFCSVLVVPLVFGLNLDPTSKLVLIAIGIYFITFVAIVPMFGTKLLMVYQKGRQFIGAISMMPNTQELAAGAKSKGAVDSRSAPSGVGGAGGATPNNTGAVISYAISTAQVTPPNAGRSPQTVDHAVAAENERLRAEVAQLKARLEAATDKKDSEFLLPGATPTNNLVASS